MKIPMHLIPRNTSNLDVDSLEHDVKINSEINSPHQEGVISEIYQRPYKLYIQESPELQGQVDTGKLVQKILLKQADVDEILKIIQRKALKGTHLHVIIREMLAEYLISSYFNDLYLYPAKNKLPNTKSAIRKVETLAEDIYYWIHYCSNQ